MGETGKDIELAAKMLSDGGLVAIPTETVYGLAANALNERAVLNVFKVKQRPFFDPLIIHVSSISMAKRYAFFDDKRLLKLAKAFWPGPLTLLLPKKENVSDLITSGLPRVAIRVPKHSLTLRLINALDLPLAAPSANPFGYVSPTETAHVRKQLGDKIDYLLDGGSCKVGLESTIVGIEGEEICVFRLGGLPIEKIEGLVGSVKLCINTSDNPKVPGQLKSHYAPDKPLFIGNLSELIRLYSEKKIALIYFGEEKYDGRNLRLFNLSKTKMLDEAALNLFKFLRMADESDSDVVLCEKFPDEGLGRAINDRLMRASV